MSDPHGLNYATAGTAKPSLDAADHSLRLVPRYPAERGAGKTDGAFEAACDDFAVPFMPRPFGRRTTGPLPINRIPPVTKDIAMTDAAAKPALRHKTSAERKAEPIHSGPMMYHPDALAAHARLCVAGNIKHNGPGVPLSWARGKSDDHLECAARHMLTPDAIDPETGETELTAAFWRLGCALQLQQERLLRAKGILPYSGVVS